ncbi:MAG: hypothetical protein J5656_03010 [Clostridia bacterium]|nr:hypothetical protein [Clostridia bacterium]
MSKKENFEPDFYYSDYVAMNAPRAGIKGFFDKHRTTLQFILFMVLSLVCFISQIIVLNVFQAIFEKAGYTQELHFALEAFNQPLNVFIGFLAGNVVAKVLSFILNYKTTFKSNSNKLFSFIGYVIMVVALIIVETIIGGPLAEALSKWFISMGADPEGIFVAACPTISMILYSAADFIIVFLMDKFVLMRQVDKTPDTIKTLESGIVVDYNEFK